MARCAYTNVEFARIFILTTDGTFFGVYVLVDLNGSNGVANFQDNYSTITFNGQHLGKNLELDANNADKWLIVKGISSFLC